MSGARTDLTSIRLTLASAVILSHSFFWAHRAEPGFLGDFLGGWAVVGFFLLSGYLITSSWRGDPDWRRFAARRVLRIVPGFVAASLICIFAIAPAFGIAPTSRDMVRLLLLQEPIAHPFAGAAVDGPMWTISWEVACYAAVPLVWAAVRWQKATIAVVPTVLLWALVTHPQAGPIRMLVAFLVGSSLSFLQLPSVNLPRIPDVSYGTYLYGWPIQGALVVVFGIRDPWMLFALALPLALAAGWLSFRFIERPAMNLRPRRTLATA